MSDKFLFDELKPDGERIIDLGCGDSKIGNIGVDIVETEDVDVIHDLEKPPYPFKDNEFDGAYIICVLEHLESIRTCLNEVHRILKPESCVYLTLPHFTYSCGYGDPTHKRTYSVGTLDFISGESGEYWDIKNFEVVERRIRTSWGCKMSFFDNVFSKILNFYENSFLCYLNPGRRIHAKIKVRKQ